MCVHLLRVDYQPGEDSLMSYILGNKTAISATLPNLQCNTVYTINVYVEGAQTSHQSPPRAVSLPARGIYGFYIHVQ